MLWTWERESSTTNQMTRNSFDFPKDETSSQTNFSNEKEKKRDSQAQLFLFLYLCLFLRDEKCMQTISTLRVRSEVKAQHNYSLELWF
jgi:hypothetical protein